MGKSNPKAVKWASENYQGGESRVAEIAAEIIVDILSLDTPIFTPATSLVENLEMDDMEIVEVVTAIEERLGREVGIDDARSWEVVGDIVSYLAKQNCFS